MKFIFAVLFCACINNGYSDMVSLKDYVGYEVGEAKFPVNTPGWVVTNQFRYPFDLFDHRSSTCVSPRNFMITDIHLWHHANGDEISDAEYRARVDVIVALIRKVNTDVEVVDLSIRNFRYAYLVSNEKFEDMIYFHLCAKETAGVMARGMTFISRIKPMPRYGWMSPNLTHEEWERIYGDVVR